MTLVFLHIPHFLPVSTKLILSVIFNLYKIKLVDPWVRQKRDQHVLQNTGCNLVVKEDVTRTSQNDKDKMADMIAKYFKVNLI